MLLWFIEQRGQLKRPDHADLRYKCRTYARLLQHLKVILRHCCKFQMLCQVFFFLSYYFTCLNVQSLDKNCLGSLRKAYCGSLNLLLRREVNDHKSFITSSWSYCVFLVYFQNIYPCEGCTTKFQLLMFFH